MFQIRQSLMKNFFNLKIETTNFKIKKKMLKIKTYNLKPNYLKIRKITKMS